MSDKEEMLKKLQAQVQSKAGERIEEKASKYGVSIEVIKYVDLLEERIEQLEKKVKLLESNVLAPRV